MRIIEPSVEILTPLDAETIYKHLEKCGRVCYKSEGKTAPGSAEKFLKRIVMSGHESVLEHFSVTFKVICDRAVSHQIVRHRIASYSQESQRYCVAGDMKLITTNPHNRPTVKELYDNKVNSTNGAWKRMRVEQYNEETGELVFSKVKNIVHNGQKKCISIKTKLGYEIVCTPDHLIMTDNGYMEAGSLAVKGKVMVNGTDQLYKNRDWLYHQNITLDKPLSKIADEFGFNVNTVKKWAKKNGIPAKGKGYYNKGRRAWNKGVQDERQIQALRTYHHCGRRKDKILKEDTVKYAKHKGTKCAICGTETSLEVHHIDKNHDNNSPDNLVTLCGGCHARVHAQNLLVAYADEIVAIEDVGVMDVYDIEMDSNIHNFVANGVVVHNCNYTKDGFQNEITVVLPAFATKDHNLGYIWEAACQTAEQAYFRLIKEGCTPQEARAVLPNCTKTEIVCTMNIRELRHFLKLRTSKAADPAIRVVAKMLLSKTKEAIPVLFDDIEVEE